MQSHLLFLWCDLAPLVFNSKIRYGSVWTGSVYSYFTNCFYPAVMFGDEHFFSLKENFPDVSHRTITYLFLVNWILGNPLSRVNHVYMLHILQAHLNTGYWPTNCSMKVIHEPAECQVLVFWKFNSTSLSLPESKRR